ncbi:hypothetical protein F5Y12DRAFT_755553 [Xylaria sp. FL1777]|nr:hypothetical protein F5Y12DRAFT_755553 [Xylaria sp. FL1777]
MTCGGERANPFLARLILSARASENKFLIVESKLPSKETQPTLWSESVKKLARYLANIA